MGIDIRKSDSDLRSSGKTRHEHHWEFERWLRFTGVVAGAVLRLVRNLVAWRRSLDIPGWFSMRSIERQTFERSNDWFPAFEETHGDRFG